MSNSFNFFKKFSKFKEKSKKNVYIYNERPAGKLVFFIYYLLKGGVTIILLKGGVKKERKDKNEKRVNN